MPEKREKEILVSHQAARQRKWKSKDYRDAYRKLKPRFVVIRELVNRRNQLGITQKELAGLSHTHQSRISKIESSNHDIRLSTIVEMANALDADVEIRIVPRLSRNFYSEVDLVMTEISQEKKRAWSVPRTSVSRKKERVFG